MGNAIDIHFYYDRSTQRLDGNNIQLEKLYEIRDKFFVKFLNAKEGWSSPKNRYRLEPIGTGKNESSTWVHMDISKYDNIYKDHRFYTITNTDLVGESLITIVKKMGFPIATCTGISIEKESVTTGSTTLFTEQDAEEALKIIYNEYGEEKAKIVERMYRCECSHFKSDQYKYCGLPGMEAVKGKTAPYYGWTTLKKIIESESEFKTTGIWSAFEGKGLSEEGGNPQDTLNKKDFIKINSVLGGMKFLIYYMDQFNGNYARWYNVNSTEQEAYKKKLGSIIPRITNQIKEGKK